ncbi:HIT domain-containing protein [Candidatus Pelagibacter sp. Uisw_134_02]|uniref:HIT domain-containing protein n=1 Tax=Candidatus Pelagibacter sp. Uisw_134_02 TaxID=3230990 RepID=UPI0039EBC7E3|tara:strand:+ start:80 stop:478 length:399 start_codon:yes stop_codon:yes gene_type:complete
MANNVSKSFLKDTHLIVDLKLCSIRLIDNAKFPWIILIPKRKNINDISELNSKDQMLLMKEIVHCSNLMKKIFKTKKLNVEKIGNIVPQLHVHIIARSTKDSTWPLSVWVVKSKPYSKESLTKIIDLLKKYF